MKKLTLLVITLILALTVTSCTAIKGALYKYEVKFDLNGGVAGEGFAESVTVKHGKTVSMTTPTMENFTFVGWFDGDEQYTESTPITKDVKLTSKWEFNNTYTLTFETNGMANIPAAHPIIGELPIIPTVPEVEGHVFAGWYFDAEYTTRYFFDHPLGEATTLYAKFYDLSLGEYTVISNIEQLKKINDDPSAKYLLACDINCKGEILTPIDEFTGEIDGNGYKIHNFTISETTDIAGFIRTNKGTVQNLSFGDFIFDILNNSAVNKYYGMVAGINEGSIINCHILDSEINIDTTLSYEYDEGNITFNAYIGAIAGYNKSEITNSKNRASINLTSLCNAIDPAYAFDSRIIFVSNIGGITGANDTNASLTKCYNIGNISGLLSGQGAYQYTGKHTGEQHPRIGGVIGNNKGTVNDCYNISDIMVEMKRGNAYTYADIRIGGTVGNNNGEIINSYSKGSINCKGDNDAVLLGGFGAYNQGKIYNCYTTTTILCESTITSIGGFVAENKLVTGYAATINKCFVMGNITLASVPTNNCGYIVAKDTGTIKDCYYVDSMAINVKTVVDGAETLDPITPSNDIGEVKSESELLSVDFIENTLYFDRMVWFLVDGELPELR